MAGVIDGVDRRTQLVGQNRLELLLFRLNSGQRYGINVFKVREVIRCPSLNHIPGSNHLVRGVANMRGSTVPVIDLSLAIGHAQLPDSDACFVIITEFNRRVQGFLVGAVDRIVNMNWESILAPPRGTGNRSYMTAVTEVDGALVEIIDVEKVLAEINGASVEMPESVVERLGEHDLEPRTRALVVDDSVVARRQITQTLDGLGIEYEVACNGRQALELLQGLLEAGTDVPKHFQLVISDVEMPEMDGYTLARNIKSDDRTKALPVILHTSLSGVFNQAMVEKVGADRFCPKFTAAELANAVLDFVQPHD